MNDQALTEVRCSVEAIAELINLTPRRIQQLAKDGVIPKPKRGLYDAGLTIRAYVEFLQKATEGRAPDATSAAVKVQKSRLLEAQARRAELETAKAEGKMLDVNDVQQVFNEMATVVASGLEALPGRVAGELATITDPAVIRQRLLREARQIRSSLADKFQSLAANGGSAPAAKRRQGKRSK